MHINSYMKTFIIENLKDKNGNIKGISQKSLLNKFPDEYNEILNLTSFLPKYVSLSARCKLILADELYYPKCVVCGNNTKISKSGISPTCSTSCAKIKQVNSLHANNNKDDINKKRIATNIQRHGVSNPGQLPDHKNKIANTLLERYGDSKYNNKVAKEKTCVERYGVKNVFSSDKIKDKIKRTNFDKYGVEYNAQQHISQEAFQCLNSKSWMTNQYITKELSSLDLSDLLNVTPKTIQNYLKGHNIAIRDYITDNTRNKLKISNINTSVIKRSIAEKEIEQFIKSVTDSVVLHSDRSILEGQELDIYIPDFKIAIEYNGLYWHSSAHKDANYHLNKTEACEAKGIQLFHIFENEWIDPDKREIWKSMIKNRMGLSNRIYARKCEIREVDTKEAREFCVNNHMQGYTQASIKYGLYYNDELMSLITISKSRYCFESSYEIIRFCNKLNVSVVGGFSKLLKRFRTLYKGMIVSYANRRWSTGGLYEQNGFNNKEITVPNYWYWKDGELESRLKFQKHKLEKALDFFDSNKTEYENMFNNGYSVIYDSGNIKYNLL